MLNPKKAKIKIIISHVVQLNAPKNPVPGEAVGSVVEV